MEQTHGNLQVNSPLPLLVLLGLAIPPAIVVMHAANYFLVLENRFLNLEGESNPTTWASSGFFLAAAAAALTSASFMSTSRDRLGWTAVSLLALALSLDEIAGMHESVEYKIGTPNALTLTEPLAAMIVVTGLLALAAASAKSPRRLLVLAASILVTAQALASTAGLFTTDGTYYALSAVEETAETWFAVALLAAAVTAGGRDLMAPRLAMLSALDWWRGYGRSMGLDSQGSRFTESARP